MLQAEAEGSRNTAICLPTVPRQEKHPAITSADNVAQVRVTSQERIPQREKAKQFNDHKKAFFGFDDLCSKRPSLGKA